MPRTVGRFAGAKLLPYDLISYRITQTTQISHLPEYPVLPPDDITRGPRGFQPKRIG